MVAVFSVFGALQAMLFKQFGVGLASAILIDATIVRAVLLPASMKLLGDWNWYLPKWLEWLPHFEHGEKLEPVEAPAVRAGSLAELVFDRRTLVSAETHRAAATRVAAALRSEVGLARLGFGVIGLHVVDDNFLQPEPGVSASEHLVSGLVPLGLLIGAAAIYPCVRAGLRGALALVFGVLGVVGGTEAAYYAQDVGLSGDDYTDYWGWAPASCSWASARSRCGDPVGARAIRLARQPAGRCPRVADRGRRAAARRRAAQRGGTGPARGDGARGAAATGRGGRGRRHAVPALLLLLTETSRRRPRWR